MEVGTWIFAFLILICVWDIKSLAEKTLKHTFWQSKAMRVLLTDLASKNFEPRDALALIKAYDDLPHDDDGDDDE